MWSISAVVKCILVASPGFVKVKTGLVCVCVYYGLNLSNINVETCKAARLDIMQCPWLLAHSITILEPYTVAIDHRVSVIETDVKIFEITVGIINSLIHCSPPLPRTSSWNSWWVRPWNKTSRFFLRVNQSSSSFTPPPDTSRRSRRSSPTPQSLSGWPTQR